MKRGTDHVWQFNRYKHDLAYYASCKCGFVYGCYKGIAPCLPDIYKLYRYCPNCGARKKRFDEKIRYIGFTPKYSVVKWDEKAYDFICASGEIDG